MYDFTRNTPFGCWQLNHLNKPTDQSSVGQTKTFVLTMLVLDPFLNQLQGVGQ